jgi:hypothetical protein
MLLDLQSLDVDVRYDKTYKNSYADKTDPDLHIETTSKSVSGDHQRAD